MPKSTVTNDGLTVATHGTTHVALFDPYDYCWTIAKDLAPFPNYVPSTLLKKGRTETVTIAHEPIWTEIGELGPESFPAHIGKNRGDHSRTYRYEATPTSWSPDVVAEGHGVVRRTDTTFQNHRNTTGNVIEDPLQDETSMEEFCAEWAALKKAWPYLNKEQRLAAIKMIANKQLNQAGIPGADRVVGADLPPGTNAQFNPRTWSIEINNARLVDGLSDDDLYDLGGTLWHEMRHAEQFWYVARFAAWDVNAQYPGPLERTFWTSHRARVPLWVAYFAQRDPLTMDLDDWRTQLAADVISATYGDALLEYNEVLRQIAQTDAAIDDLLAKNGGNENDPAVQALQDKRNALYQRYRESAPEKDAFAAEKEFEEVCARPPIQLDIEPETIVVSPED